MTNYCEVNIISSISSKYFSQTQCCSLVFRFNEFDHKFFGISDSEVEQMDPQQKQLLQCVYRALENAGIPLENASGTRTGVFFGEVAKISWLFPTKDTLVRSLSV